MTGETRRGSAASSPGYDEASIACCSGFPTCAPGPWKMANPVREYDWGSTGALAALQGHEPSGRPEAELWMGAHSTAPSRLRQSDGSIGYSDKLRHGETGKGLNDYDTIFRTLAGVGFAGWISVEDGMNGMDELRRSVEFLKRKRAEYYAGPV